MHFLFLILYFWILLNFSLLSKTSKISLALWMPSQVGKDIKLDAAGSQFEPYLPQDACPCGVTSDAVPKQ